jgi:hypothetical protein
MTDTIDIEADDEIDTLTTLMEAKTGNHVLPAEAIREAVAYWLDSHEVAECDNDGVVTPAAPEPQTVIRHRDIDTIGEELSEMYPYHNSGLGFQDDSDPGDDDAPLSTTRGDDGTIPKR